MQAQAMGCLGLVAAGLIENPPDQRPLYRLNGRLVKVFAGRADGVQVCRQRLLQPARGRAGWSANCLRQMRREDRPAAGNDGRVLPRVAEFADIARPSVLLEYLRRLIADRRRLARWGALRQ